MTDHFSPLQRCAASAADIIGMTPMVALDRITAGTGGQILAKCEFLNPGFSKKDRFARQVIEDAEHDGRLKPGQTVVELTSGNTGTGLAIVCGVKGYPFVAVMSKGNSSERARMMQALGAEVVLVDQCASSIVGQVSGEDLERVETETQRLVKERCAFRADQFNNWSNERAHLLHTGPEMVEQSAGKITAFCDFAGTAGSFAGCARALRNHNPSIACYLVEPAGAAALKGETITRPGHRIQGGGYARSSLTFLDGLRVDGHLTITDDEAVHGARRLAKEEGLFTGFSSGANLAAALKLLAGPCRGGIVAIILNDSGLKYLSTGLWDSPLSTQSIPPVVAL